MPRREDEVAILQYQNNWYIEDDMTYVEFIPYPEVITRAGGRRRDIPGPTRPPQRVRFIPSDRQRTTNSSAQEFGSTQTEVPLMLIGNVDLEVERGDRFVQDGVEYRVTEVQPATSAPFLRRVTAFAIPPDGL